MKKKMKRPLAVLLALIMMFSTVSGTGLNLSAEELQTSEVEILTTEDSTADTEEDKSGDTKDINQEEAPEAENESEGDELTESEESEDEVEPTGDIESEAGVQPASDEAEPAAQDIGDIESEADVQPASEEEDKSDPVTESEDDADDEESEKTEASAEITRYDYKSDEVNVLVTLTDPADLPDAAELVVESITLQREAQKNIEEAAAEEGIFVEEIKAFDIKFMLDGEEVQPGATVKVSVSVPEFKPSEEASAVYHVDENNEVENMESEVAADGEVVFDAPHFSTYVIVDGSIINDANQTIRMIVKHFEYSYKSGDQYSEVADLDIGDQIATYQLFTDDIVDVPSGGKINNYLKAAGWKPGRVIITAGAAPVGGELHEATGYIDFSDTSKLLEIEIDESMASEVDNVLQIVAWVYYAPETERVYGDASFYDYTVKAGTSGGIYYSVNMDVVKDATKPTLIVGHAGSDTDENYSSIRNSSYVNALAGPNRGSEVSNLNVSINNNQVVFDGYPEPGFFVNSDWSVQVGTETRYLRKVYNDFQLGFSRSGNTYTFDQVILNVDSNQKYYDKGVSSEWDKNGQNFYPLDDFAGEFEGPYKYNHNYFFGMRYDIEFNIGDYLGDMTFSYESHDEVWVILDGNISVVNKTGSAKTKDTINLWDELGQSSKMLTDAEKDQKHTLTILYLDRYAYRSNSLCEFEFTIPNAVIKSVSPSGGVAPTTSLNIQAIDKTLDESVNSKAGARFQLVDSTGKIVQTSTTAAFQNPDTESDGISFTVSQGEYLLKLDMAPSNYVAEETAWKVVVDENLNITLTEGDSNNVITPVEGIYQLAVTKVTGTKITLKTVSEDGNTVLGGAKFSLENPEGVSEILNSDFITGELTFKDLTVGEYTLTHLKEPKGCELMIKNVTQWTVNVTMTEGIYSINIEPSVENEDGAYIFKYNVNKDEYIKPEEALTYDKTAKVFDWDKRTYEIDISAQSLPVETIQQINTTYGEVVFDHSTSMYSTFEKIPVNIGNQGDKLATLLSGLNKEIVYRMGTQNQYEFVLYRNDLNDLNGWYRYQEKGYDADKTKWKKISEDDEYEIRFPLKHHNNKFDYLREVSIGYIENLFMYAQQSKLGLSQFNSLDNTYTKSLIDVCDVTNVQTFYETILNMDDNLSNQGSRLGEGLKIAYERFFTGSELLGTNISKGTPTDLYTTAREAGIPLYVIVISDGIADDREAAEVWATALKEKGITVYTVATNNKAESGYKVWLKQAVASYGCAYEAEDPSELSEIFSQIQKTLTVATLTNATVRDCIDERFVILDDNAAKSPITKEYYEENKVQICTNDCEEGTCSCTTYGVEVKYDGKNGFVYYENDKQFIQWSNQTISGDGDNWKIMVQAREDYIGGNNITTNDDSEPIIISSSNKQYSVVSPTVNVKADLKVADHEYMLYKGEKVPTNDDVLNELFDRSSNSKYSKDAFVKYGIMESVEGTDPISLNWYSDEGCTQQVDLATKKADSGKSYYLKVTYDTTEPSNESNANTTDSAGVVHYVGTANGSVYRQDAVNVNDPNLSYGTYTINVWELIKRDAETKDPLSGAKFELSSNANTYTGESNNEGSVEWNYNKDETSQSILAPINELDIAAGEYKLTETVAPNGYSLITKPWEAEKKADAGWITLPEGDDRDIVDGITKVYINNEKAPSAIKITKTVTGNLGSKTKPFTFTVTLTDAKNVANDLPTATQNDSYKVDQTEKNKATFELTDGDSIIIDNLPVGAKLTILESTADLKESDGNHYTVAKVENNNEDVTKQYDENTGITVEITDSTSTVAFTNNRSATLDTGILSDTPKVQNTLLAVTFAASVIGILAYLDRKRSKYDYRR